MKDILAEDRQLAAEIMYDIKQCEEQEKARNRRLRRQAGEQNEEEEEEDEESDEDSSEPHDVSAAEVAELLAVPQVVASLTPMSKGVHPIIAQVCSALSSEKVRRSLGALQDRATRNAGEKVGKVAASISRSVVDKVGDAVVAESEPNRTHGTSSKSCENPLSQNKEQSVPVVPELSIVTRTAVHQTNIETDNENRKTSENSVICTTVALRSSTKAAQDQTSESLATDENNTSRNKEKLSASNGSEKGISVDSANAEGDQPETECDLQDEQNSLPEPADKSNNPELQSSSVCVANIESQRESSSCVGSATSMRKQISASKSDELLGNSGQDVPSENERRDKDLNESETRSQDKPHEPAELANMNVSKRSPRKAKALTKSNSPVKCTASSNGKTTTSDSVADNAHNTEEQSESTECFAKPFDKVERRPKVCRSNKAIGSIESTAENKGLETEKEVPSSSQQLVVGDNTESKGCTPSKRRKKTVSEMRMNSTALNNTLQEVTFSESIELSAITVADLSVESEKSQCKESLEVSYKPPRKSDEIFDELLQGAPPVKVTVTTRKKEKVRQGKLFETFADSSSSSCENSSGCVLERSTRSSRRRTPSPQKGTEHVRKSGSSGYATYSSRSIRQSSRSIRKGSKEENSRRK